DLLRSLRADADPSLVARLRNGNRASEEAELRDLFAASTGLVETETQQPRPPSRLREALLDRTGIDLDELVHPLLIRLCGAYLDQGMAYWPMPNREQGFLSCVRSLLARNGAVFPEYLRQLGAEFRRQSEPAMDSGAVVTSALDHLGVAPDDYATAIQSEMLALPGWAGMMYRLEREPHLAPHQPLPCSLMDYLAVRLTMVKVAADSVARANGIPSLKVLLNE